MRDVTAHIEVRDKTTVLSLYGTVDADRVETLQEVLDMAYAVRPRGPIVVDLAEVDYLADAAVLVLRRAAADAARAGRGVTVRNLRAEDLPDARLETLLRPPGQEDRGTARASGRSSRRRPRAATRR